VKRLAIVLAAALATVSIYAVTAPAGPEAVSPRTVKALQAKVAKLQKDLKTVTTAVNNCLFVGAAPVAAFGGTTEGYYYGTGGSTITLESALDVVPQAQQAQATWLVATSATCASIMNSGRVVSPKTLATTRRVPLGPLARLTPKP
jgi:hypothetical protein